MPAEHPARDMQDTLYLAAPVPPAVGPPRRSCARTPPACRSATWRRISRRFASSRPARCTAATTSTLTHTPMFHQVEGLVVGEGVTMADLKGTLVGVPAPALRPRHAGAVPAQLLPVHRAERRHVHRLPASAGDGLRDVQEDGLARSARQRHGASGGVRGRGLRPERYTGFAFGVGIERLAHADRTAWTTSALFYENDLRFLEQFAVVRLLVSWLRDFVDVRSRPPSWRELLSMRGFELAAIEPVPGRRRRLRHRLRDHGQPARLPERDRPRARGGDGARPAAAEPSPAAGPPLRLAAVETGRSDRVRVEHRGPRAVPAIRRRSGGGRRRTLAGLARRTAGGGRRAADQQHRRHHQLRAAGDRPADARVRPRRARRLGASGFAARRPGERLRTLDGQDRALTPDMLVIADARPPAGGRRRDGRRRSEVAAGHAADRARERLLRAASVRRTSKRLGLKTEASARFERGADIDAPAVGLCARVRAARDTSAPAAASARWSTATRRRGAPRRVGLRRASDRAPAGHARRRSPTSSASSTGLGFAAAAPDATAGR